jgi:hypothetical protein
MGGGLLQLQAYGTENIYLSGNPQMTFFKMVYRRFTHFGIQPIEVNFESFDSLSYTTPTRIKLKIPRNGDLITKMFLNINLPDIYASQSKYFKWIKYLGAQMISSIRVIVGSSTIEEYTGEYINLYHEMTMSDESLKTYYEMIGHVPEVYDPKDNRGVYPYTDISSSVIDGSYNYLNKRYNTLPTIPSRRLSIPLPFWFHRNNGLALPLIALQYHEVFVEVTFRPIQELYLVTYDQSYTLGTSYKLKSIIGISNEILEPTDNYIRKYWTKPLGNSDNIINFTKLGLNTWPMDPKLEISYIFLDEDERKYFAQNDHKYLVEKVIFYSQYGVKNRNTFSVELFHPAREIYVLPRRSINIYTNDWTNYTNLDKEDINPYDYQTYLLQYAKLQGNMITTLGSMRTDMDRFVDVSFNNFAIYGKDSYNTTDIQNLLELWNHRDISNIPVITSSNYQYYTKEIINNMQILLNGNAYIDPKRGSYFSQNQPFLNHTNNRHPGVLAYSFALEPEKFQPSGVLNFSQIQTIDFVMDMKEPMNYESIGCPLYYNMRYDIFFYVVTYNIFQVIGGMGSLMFSN